MTAMKTPWTLLAALLAASAAGLAWRANLHVRATKMATADATATHSRFVAESDRVQKAIAESGAARAGLEAELGRLNSTMAGRSAVKPSPAVTAARLMRPEPTPRDDASRVARFRGGLAQRYSPFYRMIGFTPEQVTRFEDLLTEQEGRLVDFLAATREGTVALSPAERQALRAQEQARIETELRQLLGDTGYERLQEYQKSGNQRRIVRELVSGLALSASPLSVEQGRQLMRLLDELRFNDSGGAERESWAPVLERASGFLTPAQMLELQAIATKSRGLAALNSLSRLAREAKGLD